MRLGVIACVLAGVSTAASAQRYQRTDSGIIVTPAQGPVVRLQVYGGGIIRVTESPAANPGLAPSLMVRAKPLANAFTVGNERTSPIVTLSTGKSSAAID